VRKNVILIVVDGMTPAAFERAVEGGRAPALAYLAEHGVYRRATSVFPSLTPVCLSSIATGAGPDVHRIPHLVWWHRGEQRIVEYGSSFAALRAAGMAQSLTDTIFNMNEKHLGRDAVTVFESLEDAGLVTAAVNITCYRGRNRHVPTLPWMTKPAFGPKRFFFYNLFESDQTGAPLSIRNRAGGSTDAYAAAVGRWLVTRDGFDFLAYYLSDFDFASHAHGPAGADDVALERTDAAIAALLDAAGGPDAFLERYAVVLHSDHGQTNVDRAGELHLPLRGLENEIVVTASNRAG
jgi:predicted AlkP superfamily pyrophosphatase or phosphodiesterase